MSLEYAYSRCRSESILWTQMPNQLLFFESHPSYQERTLLLGLKQNMLNECLKISYHTILSWNSWMYYLQEIAWFGHELITVILQELLLNFFQLIWSTSFFKSIVEYQEMSWLKVTTSNCSPVQSVWLEPWLLSLDTLLLCLAILFGLQLWQLDFFSLQSPSLLKQLLLRLAGWSILDSFRKASKFPWF